ncbi:hypothetical protein AM586_17190 [Massilia sp. WG5]|nr:hypothetical protein AM586_17190 [Massilia sp. WG5]
MGYFFCCCGWFDADLLGWAVAPYELREPRFNRIVAIPQRVVFSVCQLRIVCFVVFLVVISKQLCELS